MIEPPHRGTGAEDHRRAKVVFRTNSTWPHLRDATCRNAEEGLLACPQTARLAPTKFPGATSRDPFGCSAHGTHVRQRRPHKHDHSECDEICEYQGGDPHGYPIVVEIEFILHLVE